MKQICQKRSEFYIETIQYRKSEAMSVCGNLRHSFFRSVREAFVEAGIPYYPNDESSMVVWSDAIRPLDYFTDLRPWQVVNRIQNMHVLCRKASFAGCVMKMKKRYPKFYASFPDATILPSQLDSFLKLREQTQKTYIIKPDGGSFGSGITVLRPDMEYKPSEELAIAQEYIEAYLIDGHKFDLRVYVLVASVDPLEVYVYRDGLVRLCAESYDKGTMSAVLANVAISKDNPNVEIESVSKLISEVFPSLERDGVNIAQLWREIDRVALLSIVACHGYLKAGLEWCPGEHYSRCFQILGFDILLDKDMKPHVIEVNYRPMLEYFRGAERRMKVSMIRDALLISCPYAKLQTASAARKWFDSRRSWDSYVGANPEFLESAKKVKEDVLAKSKFHRVWPLPGDRGKLIKSCIACADALPLERNMPGYRPLWDRLKNI